MWSLTDGRSCNPSVGLGVFGLSGTSCCAVPTVDRPLNHLFNPERRFSNFDRGCRGAVEEERLRVLGTSEDMALNRGSSLPGDIALECVLCMGDPPGLPRS